MHRIHPLRDRHRNITKPHTQQVQNRFLPSLLPALLLALLQTLLQALLPTLLQAFLSPQSFEAGYVWHSLLFLKGPYFLAKCNL